MKRIILFIATAVATLTSWAATDNLPTGIDRAQIQSSAQSDTYATLLQRFKSGEALSMSDMATIYYGSALQPGFNANAQYPAVMEAYLSGDLTQAYMQATQALDSDPTNLSLLFKAYACMAILSDNDAKAKASALQSRIIQICDVIFTSGRGIIDSSPYMVIRPNDIDEFLMKYIQPTSVIGTSKLGDTDAVKVTLDGVQDEIILYFNQFK